MEYERENRPLARDREEKKGLHVVDLVALIIAIIGGLNWGLVGLFNFNLVTAIFGFAPVLVRLIYILVGLSAIYCAVRAGAMAHMTREANTPPDRDRPPQTT